MAVTKRTRYEVLKRDNHTCRYCHDTESPLTVDHVIPTALGGTDAPDNLVAACKDCNAGKSSSAPDANLVADVRQDALRHAELVRQAYDVLVHRMGERDEYIEQFEAAYGYKMPTDWRNSVGRWFEMGVPVELVVDAASIATSKARTFQGTDRFAYMCGIVWNQVQMVDTLAETYRHVAGKFVPADEMSDVVIDAYNYGYKQAVRDKELV